MSIISSTWPPVATDERVTTDAIRALIAQQLRVNVGRVTDEAHLADDLGADWFDRLELMIAIEDQFARVEIVDDAIDQIEVVGDLIRFIQTMDHKRAAPPSSNLT